MSKKKISSYNLWIPNNINLDELLCQHSLRIANARDKLAYLLHIIHAVPAFSYNVDINQTDGYTILSSTYLQKRVDEYNVLINWLEDRDIITVKREFFPGQASMGYKFTPRYQQELKKQLITSWPLIKSILEGKKRSKKASARNYPKLKPENLYGISSHLLEANLSYSYVSTLMLSFLKQCFDNWMHFDSMKAESYLRRILAIEMNDPSVIQPMSNFNSRMMVVNALIDGLNNSDILRFKVDETSGRLHTPLTSLKSELKASIKYRGKLIVSADIKNSQPLLSLVFLDKDLFSRNRMLDRISIYNEGFKDNNSQLSSMLGKLLDAGASDLSLYRKLVLSGKLYEYFGDLLKKRGVAKQDDAASLRSFAKEQIFRAFFSRNQSINSKANQALRIFKGHFPTVYEIFKTIKTGEHRTLACSLQNLEAEIVLHKTCRELNLLHPNILLLTIHDSIATTEDCYHLVEQTLKKHLNEALGSNIELRKEPWDETLIRKAQGKKKSTIPAKEESSSYGYCSEIDVVKYDTYSMRYISKHLGIGLKTLFKGLRELGVFTYNENSCNVPANIYDAFDYFKVFEKHYLRKTVPVIRVTQYGFDFIQDLVNSHSNLFPAKSKDKKKHI